MSKSNVVEFASRAGIDLLTEVCREGAIKMLTSAIEAEVQAFLGQFEGQVSKDGRAAVVRNGYLPARELQTGIGPMTIRVPKVRSRTGETVTFRSALVPPYVRKTRSLEAALPWLYLKGVSTGEMEEALKVLVGSNAKGLSASTVARLKQAWADDFQAWRGKDLGRDKWVYLWADGIHSGLRSSTETLCALVIIGVNERGEKHFLAIEDGVRESTQSWRAKCC